MWCLSTTAPDKLENHHHQLATNPLPTKAGVICWVKCDMVATVALARLDRVKGQKRQYTVPKMAAADFKAIKIGVAHALDLIGVGTAPPP